MNNLKFIRENSNCLVNEGGADKDTYYKKISNKDVEAYTTISSPVVSYLENEKRRFRQWHLETLCNFFDVSNDFMLGNSEVGIYAYDVDNDNEKLTLSKEQFLFLKKNNKIITRLVSVEMPLNISLCNNGKEVDRVVEPKCYIRRFVVGFNIDSRKKLLSESLDLLSTLDEKQIEKVNLFIKEFVK